MDAMISQLLAADEPDAVTVTNAGGRSPFVIVADHAGKYMPRALQNLGLGAADRDRHIAWDIGVGAVSALLADALDAILIRQNYSRLVIDCNRVPGTETSIAALSECTSIPGNTWLSGASAQARLREVFEPYHHSIADELDRRRQGGRPAILIAMHSFTPVFKGEARPWHVGLLYNRDPRVAASLLDLLRREPGLVVGDNEPYAVTDTSDYTIPVHGEQRGLPHVGIEIRQDLITDAAGQHRWAELFAKLLPQAALGLATSTSAPG